MTSGTLPLFGLTFAACLSVAAISGCAPVDPSGGESSATVYNNTTDSTNQGATRLGHQACGACHWDVAAKHRLHGHGYMLNRIEGSAPVYPAAADRAGVPQPPADLSWSDISYVIGGYTHRARFLDKDGYLLATGESGFEPQWNLAFAANGTDAGFVASEPASANQIPYDYTCFVCHATGAMPQNPNAPEFQENRKGILGTWIEAGIQCENCHGPGSRHVANPSNRDLFVDVSAQYCGRCHARSYLSTSNTIYAEDGFIQSRQQYAELSASGGHANLGCVACHEPHASANYESAGAMRSCTTCHPDQDLGFHTGKQYIQGDYLEPLSCVSCHMPFASRSASSAIVGESNGRIGDLRTHIFRISLEPVDYSTMFMTSGNEVLRDASGRAAVTVDFVCLRCHNSDTGPTFKLTLRSASEIAAGIHGFD